MNTVNIEIRRAERNFWAVLATIALSLLFAATCNAQTPAEWKSLKGDVSVFIANDLGRNGYYDQKPIAELMGEMADEIGPEAIVATGDVHHFDGVASVNDPLWMTNYELVYSHPELMISWYPVLGNHEYRGNTQAVIDYSKVSRRWQMPDRYYSKVFADDDAGTKVGVLLMIYGEGRTHHGIGKRTVGDMYGVPVEEGSMPLLSREHLARAWHIDYSHDDVGIVAQAHADGTLVYATAIVGCAVDGVDNPQVLVVDVAQACLLAQEATARQQR